MSVFCVLNKCQCLTHFADSSNVYVNTVDIFNATAGTWSTAVLSAARGNLAATSLPNLGLAIFAGGLTGYSTCCRVCFRFSGCISFVRRIYGWNKCSNVLDKCQCLILCADGNAYSVAVDIFNATAGTWSTAVLSAARWAPAATSLPNLGVAIFAGGEGA